MSDLIERNGEVVGFVPGGAQIRLAGMAACGSCGARAACSSGNSAQMVNVKALPPTTQIGDQVCLTMPAASLARAALIGYLVPPVGLLLGAVTAFAWLGNDLAAVVGAALGFATGLIVVRQFSSAALSDRLAPTCTSMASNLESSTGESV